jgi:predicted MFS family arabinose efflux permease
VLIARGVSKHLRGLAYAFVATSLGVISLPAPWIGSQIWVVFGPKSPFIFTSVLGILALVPAWFRLRLPEAGKGPEDDRMGDASSPGSGSG